MIRIRYRSKPNDELDLEGSNQELSELRQQILRLEQGDLVFDAEQDYDPNPYDRALNRLHVTVADSLLDISVVDGELCIQSRKDLLDRFANDLPWDAQHTSDQDNYHRHFDRVWYPDSFTDRSLEIVLTLKR